MSLLNVSTTYLRLLAQIGRRKIVCVMLCCLLVVVLALWSVNRERESAPHVVPLRSGRFEVSVGEIRDDQVVDLDFELLNDCDGAVTGISARSNCGCAVAEIPEKVDIIGPNVKCRLRVALDPRGMRGPFQKAVYVHYEADKEPDGVLGLLISGTILQGLNVSPKLLAFDSLAYGTTYSKRVSLTSDLYPEFQIKAVSIRPISASFVTQEQLAANVAYSLDQSIAGRKDVVITMSPHPGFPRGAAMCIIELAECDRESVEVALLWDIRSSVKVFPAAVALNKKTNASIEVTSTAGPLGAYSVTTDVPGASVAVKREEPARHALEFSYLGDSDTSDVVCGYILLDFESPSCPDQRIPVIITR